MTWQEYYNIGIARGYSHDLATEFADEMDSIQSIPEPQYQQ